MSFDSASISVRDVLPDVHALYQPVVRLSDGVTVGFEALARGPRRSALERPDRLFAAARDEGTTEQLDWRCRVAALEGALAAGLPPSATLFVNVEPDIAGSPVPDEHAALFERANRDLRVVVEITERALAARPAELLAMVEFVRSHGWGIALDDVGADWRSLALMPLVRPDVVKLDMSLVQSAPNLGAALVTEAVRAYATRSGAQVVAEGIETEDHLERAIALGATLGQGWHFGRPDELTTEAADAAGGRQLILTHASAPGETPVEVAGHAAPMQVGRKGDLLAMSRALEHRALSMTEPCVVLGAFQSADRFTPATARMYTRLARRASFVGAFGVDMAPEPAPGVRGARLPDNHRLAGEWDVIVLAPHYAGALIAEDLGDDGPDAERRFRFTITHDRDLVAEAARTLMARMLAFETDDERVAAGRVAA